MRIANIIAPLISLLMWISTAQAECDSTTSLSLKSKNRDWVKTFDKLAKNYKKLEFSKIRLYFYDQKLVKSCITFQELQQLKTEANNVFSSVKKKKDVNDFLIAITAVANANDPNSKKVLYKTIDSAHTTAGQKATISIPNTKSKGVVKQNQVPYKVIKKDYETLKEEYENLKKKQSNLFWVISGLGILGVTLAGWVFWLLKEKANHKVEEQNSFDRLQRLEIDKNNRIDKIEKDKVRLIKENKQTIDELQVQLTLLKEQIADKSKSENSEILMPLPATETSTLNQEQRLEMQPAKYFYLSTPTPTSDGLCTFLDHRKPFFDPASSIYKFELAQTDENQVSFWFESNPNTIKAALNLPDLYLKPACNYTGLNSRANRIETTQPGKAVRQGGVWKVTEKAQIKFI